jgi:uncharacterized glyoxalase superfamily protein PhnB
MPAKKKTAKKTKAPAKRAVKMPAKRASGPQARRRVRRREPETLRLRAVELSLTASDLEKSLPWYRDMLGFTVKDRWEREGKLAGVELVAGSVSIYLSQDDWTKGRDRVKGAGFRIYCTTTQDVDRLAERIRERGGRFVEEPHAPHWGGRAFTVSDPDGFKLTIMSE